MGWAGSILGKELAQAGLKVVGLERGGSRSQEQFQLPEIARTLDLLTHMLGTVNVFPAEGSDRNAPRPL